MNEVESVYDASLSEPTQLEIDCAVFKAWTQGIKGQTQNKQRDEIGKYIRLNSDPQRSPLLVLSDLSCSPLQSLSWCRL